jgi:hypothetical protein
MYRDRDFDPEQTLPAVHFYQAAKVKPKLLPNEEALTQDLELNTLFEAMAGGDKFFFQVARRAILSGLQTDSETILYRQAVLKDCLRNESVVRNIYDLVVEVIENKDRQWWSVTSKLPGSILYGSIQILALFTTALGKLRRIADEHSANFESEGFKVFFALLQTELSDGYLASVNSHLKELQFRHGVFVSAKLGDGNQGTDFVLRKSSTKNPRWIERIFNPRRSAYTFHIDPRDEAGGRALGELRDRGINLVANATAQSSDHILSFIGMLRTELAFYLACVNLHRRLAARGVAICFPVPEPPGSRRHSCVELRDACLALSMASRSWVMIWKAMANNSTSLLARTGAANPHSCVA